MKKQFKLHSNKNNEGPIEHSHMGDIVHLILSICMLLATQTICLPYHLNEWLIYLGWQTGFCNYNKGLAIEVASPKDSIILMSSNSMLGCGDYPKITGETLLQTLQDYNAP